MHLRDGIESARHRPRVQSWEGLAHEAHEPRLVPGPRDEIQQEQRWKPAQHPQNNLVKVREHLGNLLACIRGCKLPPLLSDHWRHPGRRTKMLPDKTLHTCQREVFARRC